MNMTTLDTICRFLETFAPPQLAESWDNVGLLVGDRSMEVQRVMTCLTVTPSTAAEAMDRSADLIVTHHPLPFHAVKRLTTDTTPGRLLWELIGHRIAIHSPHTSFDSAAEGINQRLAQGLDLTAIAPLVPMEGADEGAGAGRCGLTATPISLNKLARQLAEFLHIDHLQVVGSLDRPVQRIGIACGAAGEFLSTAHDMACDVLVLGETNLHTYLEAEAIGTALLLPGHYASERFAVEQLADALGRALPELTVWASVREADPVAWLSWRA